MLQEVKSLENFIADLFLSAENMGIVLLETSHTDKTAKGTRDLISVQHAEIGIPQRQVSVAHNTVLEKHAMCGAVHRLETVTSIVSLKQKHVLFVVLVMTTSLPEFEIVHVGSDDFLIASDSVLRSDHFHQLVVNVSALRVEEGAAGRHLEVSEQLLSLANEAMIALLSLLTEVDVLVQLLL